MFMTLEEKLQKARIDRKLTQTDVEQLTGILRTLLSLYENDLRNPPIDKLVQLARVYHISLDYLCRLKNENTLTNMDELNDTDKAKIYYCLGEAVKKKKKINL